MITMGDLVKCSYCFEIYDADDYDMCPNCWTFTYLNHDYDLGADR